MAVLRTAQALIDLVWKDKSILDQIVTVNKSALSMHMPETEQQSRHQLEKEVPGLVKAKVHTTGT
jgi:hypothetical protein